MDEGKGFEVHSALLRTSCPHFDWFFSDFDQKVEIFENQNFAIFSIFFVIFELF